jgi:hypothetical protein
MVPEMKRSLVAGLFLVSPIVAAQAPDAMSDHWTPEEAGAPFNWGAQCTFSDGIGVVFRSNWQTRHWIKIAGNQVQFNGETEMSDAGWYQMFAGSDFTVTLRLQRVLPEPQGSDGVRLVGEIEVTRSGQIKRYQVTGSCGA